MTYHHRADAERVITSQQLDGNINHSHRKGKKRRGILKHLKKNNNKKICQSQNSWHIPNRVKFQLRSFWSRTDGSIAFAKEANELRWVDWVGNNWAAVEFKARDAEEQTRPGQKGRGGQTPKKIFKKYIYIYGIPLLFGLTVSSKGKEMVYNAKSLKQTNSSMSTLGNETNFWWVLVMARMTVLEHARAIASPWLVERGVYYPPLKLHRTTSSSSKIIFVHHFRAYGARNKSPWLHSLNDAAR